MRSTLNYCYAIVGLIWLACLTSQAMAQRFEAVSEGVLVEDVAYSYSASWGDIDNDGDLDLFVANSLSRNFLYLNSGQNVFERLENSPVTRFSGNTPSGLWVDIDRDGDLDLFVTNLGGPLLHYSNDGLGNFVEVTDPNAPSYSTRKMGPVDFNNDGEIDLLVSQRSGNDNLLLDNVGGGFFGRVRNGILVTDGGDSTCVEWADVDNDGDLDVFICNATGDNFLYENLGKGRFRKEVVSPITNDAGRTGGGTWGDFDSDGDLDLYISNVDNEINRYYRNDGNWVFTIIITGDHVNDAGSSNSATAIDIENDGDLDLFVTDLDGDHDVFINDGKGNFVKDPLHDLAASNRATAHAAWADIDRDGDLDVFLSNLRHPIGGREKNQLFVNKAEDTGNNWLHFRLTGQDSNIHGIGARIQLLGRGIGNGRGILREINGGSGSTTGGYEAAFGLGKVSVVEIAIVTWPTGKVTILKNVEANQMVDLDEGFEPPETTDSIPNRITVLGAYPNPFNLTSALEYVLSQESFVTVEVFSLLGKKEELLLREIQQKGINRVSFNGAAFPSGVYYFVVTVDGHIVKYESIVLTR